MAETTRFKPNATAFHESESSRFLVGFRFCTISNSFEASVMSAFVEVICSLVHSAGGTVAVSKCTISVATMPSATRVAGWRRRGSPNLRRQLFRSWNQNAGRMNRTKIRRRIAGGFELIESADSFHMTAHAHTFNAARSNDHKM